MGPVHTGLPARSTTDNCISYLPVTDAEVSTKKTGNPDNYKLRVEKN